MGSLEALEGKEFYAEYLGPTDPMGSDKENPVSHIAYGYATQVVILDEEGKVSKVIAAHDAGTVINPKSTEGQVEGDVCYGSWVYIYGRLPNGKRISEVKLWPAWPLRATDTPEIDVRLVKSDEVSELACGAKKYRRDLHNTCNTCCSACILPA